MKQILSLFLALVISFAPVRQAQASDIATSVVVGVLVANYAGTLAGVAASSLLAGTAVVLHSGKEAAYKAAGNDIQAFYSTGKLTASLENSIKSIMESDSSISEEEAMNSILEALN